MKRHKFIKMPKLEKKEKTGRIILEAEARDATCHLQTVSVSALRSLLHCTGAPLLPTTARGAAIKNGEK